MLLTAMRVAVIAAKYFVNLIFRKLPYNTAFPDIIFRKIYISLNTTPQTKVRNGFKLVPAQNVLYKFPQMLYFATKKKIYCLSDKG